MKVRAYRLGGDAVLAILPGTASAATAKLLETACRLLMHDSLKSRPQVALSLSIGVVDVTDPLESPVAVRANADNVQYRAKDEGKRIATPSQRPSVIAIGGRDELLVLMPRDTAGSTGMTDVTP